MPRLINKLAKPMAASNVSLRAVHRESLMLGQRVEELEDLRELNQAIERNGNKPTVPWAKVKKRLGLK